MNVKGFANVNGTRLYYEVSGSGEPIVLIHGYTLDTRMWDDQFEAFAQRYQVIRYDLRGFGKSAIPNGEIYTHPDDLLALLEHLGIAGAHILGLSLGGSIAVDFVLAYPQAVRSLIAVDVSGLNGYEWPDQLDRWFTAIRSAAGNGDMQQAKELWLATGWFKPAQSRPAVVARLNQMVSDYSGWDFTNKDSSLWSDPPANLRLQEIQAPTLVLTGEYDLPFYNLRIAERLQQGIPNAQMGILPGVGHMANMEDPETFNQVVLSFLESIGAHV
jgi:3-oxoadipate enol-lactonase